MSNERRVVAVAFSLALLVTGAPAARATGLPMDEAAKGNFSASAAHVSDVLVGAAVLMPLALQAGQGFDAATGRRALIYGETLALSLALNGATKVLVGRPRPYTYNPDPRVEAYAAAERGDARRSFYSGHASTAFAAGVSGATLFAASTDDVRARTAVWATSLLLAGATADLRVRAGKHFPSDVLVGAVVGAGVGWLVPALQGQGPMGGLTDAELVAIAVAPLAGVALGHVLPLRADVTLPLGAEARVSPLGVPGGGGVQVAGRWGACSEAKAGVRRGRRGSRAR
jgi:membrane-associated phospholipid phosphatase